MSEGAMLEGIRMVDMTGVIFGPYATEMMADLGADVIKVESPQPDPMRIAGKPARTRYMAPPHLTLNKGKRSIVLDLKTADDAEFMRELLKDADVFIHNVREQAIEKLGFSYEQVSAIRPDIIYVHCTGFGPGGPYSDLQAYDDVIQAASGATTLIGRVDGNSDPRYLPMAFADKVAGLYGAQAVLAAIVHRLRTGRGQMVQVPMFESVMHFVLQEHLFAGTFVSENGEKASLGYGRQLDPARQPFPTADGHICIVPYTDANLMSVLEAIGQDHVQQLPRFATPRDRAINISELYGLITRATPAKTTTEWIELLRGMRVPAMPVCDLDDVVADPHLAAVDFFRTREHPSEGVIREMRSPLRFSERAAAESLPAPLLGEHSQQIRDEVANRRKLANSHNS